MKQLLKWSSGGGVLKEFVRISMVDLMVLELLQPLELQ